jgi:hypothetical protein
MKSQLLSGTLLILFSHLFFPQMNPVLQAGAGDFATRSAILSITEKVTLRRLCAF